ncbi:hypothetical protein HDU67_009603 [Dinochytrium kinnereticum]|nr:hypothetical protein HDU67_009603 [Dinochytrium kinnereticum]
MSSHPTAAIVPTTNGVMEEDSFTVEFDEGRGCRYVCCYNGSLWCLWGLIPVVPLACCWASQIMKHQSCSIDSKRIHYRAGWLNRTDKLVPFERIQGAAVGQDCLAKMCGVTVVEVRTAGGGGGDEGGPEVVLVAPKDPLGLRDLIMRKRDELVIGPMRRNVGNVTTVVSAPPSAMPEMVRGFQEIRESMIKIERFIDEAHNGVVTGGKLDGKKS